MSQLLTLKQVCARVALSRASVYRRLREGGFPEPVRVGVRAVRWHATDVDAWVSSRPLARQATGS